MDFFLEFGSSYRPKEMGNSLSHNLDRIGYEIVV